MYIHLDGKTSYPNAAPERLHRGLTTLNAVIGDLHGDPIHSMQLDTATTICNPYFAVIDPNSSQSLVTRFRAMMPALPKPEPEIDMQTVGWGIADNDDYVAPIIQEWYQLELEGFPQDPEYVPFDHALYEEWMAAHHEAMIDPLDGISLFMLFLQLEPIAPEEEYFWDPELAWEVAMDLQPNLLQGYAVPNYMTHFIEDDLV
ncbi:hypothetical protein RHGRI_004885 [Rhododendron griersonianum]|uniref:Uncharacterized protein n=1 Tax=Rhododendron griersonianum TaxID=479676 RepID=A0AAV6LBI1_9ERIC|nr:hypothetical protein RHGRI_004885 [Rhododendron griersonianum]